MIFRKFMSFLFDAGRIGSHEVKSEEFVSSFVLINLQVVLLLYSCFLRVESLTKIQSSVEIMLDFSAIN